MKKLISLALAIFMILSMAVVAYAAGETTDRPTSGTSENVQGTITINGVTIENGAPVATYEIYQMLELKSYDFNTGSYDYDYASPKWEAFFTTGAGKDYLAPNDKGIYIWQGSSDAARIEEFAKIALAYAQNSENNITPSATTNTAEGQTPQYHVSGENSIVFEGLELGYYLVDSSVGALCGLSTTNPDGLINSKNGAPTLNLQVQEDLSGLWGKENSADIGQTVNYLVTIHVHDGAQNYEVYNTLEKGLTYTPNTVKVERLNGDSAAGTTPTVIPEKETKDGETVHNYSVVHTAGSQTFQVEFTDTFCDSLNTNDRLYITYSAVLNEHADIGNSTAENPSNTNTVRMHYGNDHETTDSVANTYTYGFDLVKTDGQNKLLPGAEFKVYTHEKDGETLKFVLVSRATANSPALYRLAKPDETGTTVITVTGGLVRVVGLDNGAYWVEETKHPEGYNPIEARQKFTIADNDLNALVNADGIVSTNSGVHVVNYTGTMLPETGGLGTLLFTILGGGTVLTSGVVLVTKKRMSKIEDED